MPVELQEAPAVTRRRWIVTEDSPAPQPAPPMTNAPVKETPLSHCLRRMLTYLRHFGWKQHSYGGAGRSSCLLGAAYHSGVGFYMYDVENVLYKAIGSPWIPHGREQAEKHRQVALWNDESGRTFSEVEELLERAIMEEERTR